MVTRSLVIPLPPHEGGAERQTERVLLKRQNWSTFASLSEVPWLKNPAILTGGVLAGRSSLGSPWTPVIKTLSRGKKGTFP